MLISRSGLLQIISLVGVFILTVVLSESDFGTFIIVSGLLGIMGYFSDIGLSASLIQQKAEPTVKDLRTSFTIQQTLIISLISIGFFSSTSLAQKYQWGPDVVHLWWAILIGFFLASLKTISSILVERKLAFEKLVIVETLETLIFYAVAVSSALMGKGISSYTYAVLARGIVGTTLLFFIVPWPIGIGWSIDSFKSLIKFGLPYQLNSFIAAIKDNLLNVVLGSPSFLNSSGVGYLGWGQTWTQKPLRFITDNVTRATFPSFALIQDDKEKIARGVNKLLFATSITVFPVIIAGVISIGPFVHLVPKYEKWQPALWVFYFLSINSLWASVSTPMTNILAAVGKIRWVTYLMIMWTVLTWSMVPFLSKLYGHTGAAMGMAIISFASIVPMVLVKKMINYKFSSLIPGLIASIVMLVIGIQINKLLSGILGLVVSLGISSSIFAIIIWVTSRKQLLNLWQSILSK